MRPSGSSIAETSDMPVLSRAGTPMSLGPRTRPISTNVYGTSELGEPEEPSPVGTTTARSTTPANPAPQQTRPIRLAYNSALRLSSASDGRRISQERLGSVWAVIRFEPSAPGRAAGLCNVWFRPLSLHELFELREVVRMRGWQPRITTPS